MLTDPHLHTARLTCIALLVCIAMLLVGCTTTDEVVASWKGQPIEDVVKQWGPPGDYVFTDSRRHCPHRYPQARKQVSQSQPIVEGSAAYTWHVTTHTYHPATFETRTRKFDDKCVTTTRYIPAGWTTTTDWFGLSTDEFGRVISGDSSFNRRIFPFNRMFEKHRGWGSARISYHDAE